MSALETLIGRMTVAELARLANLSVEQLVAAAFDGATPGRTARAAAPAPVPDNGARVRRGKVPRGGLRLDHVLTTLASLGGPAKLDDVRVKTGGSVPQVRSALQKLAEAGKVKITGERRGTRYLSR